MALCDSCVWKTDNGCAKAMINFPNVNMCNLYIITHYPQKPAAPKQVDWEVFSASEPTKCIFLAHLP